MGRGAGSSWCRGSVLVMMAAGGSVDQAQSIREHGDGVVKGGNGGHEGAIL